MENLTSCLNCNTPLTGKFCSSCGQEDRPQKLSVWQLLGQFFSGLLNYDGRLILSIRLLFSKPAALTLAYMEGKRSSYVNPVQFYLFTSAIFFLFSSTFSNPDLIDIAGDDEKGNIISIGSPPDDSASEAADFAKGFSEGIEAGKRMRESDSIVNLESDFESYEEYLSNQLTLKPEERSSSFELKFVEKFYQIKDKYEGQKGFIQAFGEEILNRLPQVLFITLPLLALILKLVFIRRKHYWYIDHLIFVLHIATSFFILLFIQKGLELLASSTDWSAFNFISGLLGFSWLIYYLLSFKRFFEKGWPKTLLFFFLTSFLQSIVFMVVFALLLVFAFFNL